MRNKYDWFLEFFNLVIFSWLGFFNVFGCLYRSLSSISQVIGLLVNFLDVVNF